MKIGPELLNAFYPEGKRVRRASWPTGNYMLADGAEGGRIWYYIADCDDFTANYRLGFHELGADDWEIME